jgi:UDP:flavonoid glycosyltransferase YjiC (YdhE family)
MDHFGGAQTTTEIETFLTAPTTTPVVYLGWGSMICISAAHMVELCVRAVHHAGLRAIVLGGATGLSLDQLSNDNVEPDIPAYAKTHILFVAFVPHEWLFPQVAATAVHHDGGAGTTTTTAALL